MLYRQRWFACTKKGVPSWKLKGFNFHEDIKYTDEKGVVTVITQGNKELRLDKISRVKKNGNVLYYSGFLETEQPTKGQLACFREEWEITE